MTTLDILVAARAKISTPETWCQTVVARDSEGLSVVVDDPAACQWCAMGALLLVCNRDTEAVHRAAEYLCWGLVGYNDNPETCHADIMAMFDAAIVAQPQPARGDVPMETP